MQIWVELGAGIAAIAKTVAVPCGALVAAVECKGQARHCGVHRANSGESTWHVNDGLALLAVAGRWAQQAAAWAVAFVQRLAAVALKLQLAVAAAA